ncbi:MAG: GTP pyrophosphokinase, partial [Bacillota bacterium]|nr:GTP pyrophosphokinase [Bacillota bacterium]
MSRRHGEHHESWSIHQKLVKRGRPDEEIYDLMAMRVTHATPKSNMYRSLHTTVFGPGGRRYEIQIRTEEMHRTSEYGIAAHWRY